eukprot:2981826-Lingulodinium_polyedra.AAC.1
MLISSDPGDQKSFVCRLREDWAAFHAASNVPQAGRVLREAVRASAFQTTWVAELAESLCGNQAGMAPAEAMMRAVRAAKEAFGGWGQTK